MPEIRLRGGEVDGLGLHYIVEGRGPAVVLVHGLGGFAESWRHNVALLTRQATVYALDLPGFGTSAKPRAHYRLAYFALALHGFFEALGLRQASLVGHSLGAGVCVTYALTHPTRVDRLALIGGVVPGFSFRPSWIYRLLAVPGVGDALSLLGSARLFKAALARCFHRAVREEVDFFVDHDYAARTTPDARHAYVATLRHVRQDFEARRDDYRRALATLDLPILLIHGRQDRVVPALHCAEVAEALPNASARWVDECGHFPQIEHATQVNGWLAEFLAARPAPR